MPKGPQGQKRPADTVKSAIRVARIATGEEQEDTPTGNRAAGGKKGGPARAAKLSAEDRQSIATEAAKARWKK